MEPEPATNDPIPVSPVPVPQYSLTAAPTSQDRAEPELATNDPIPISPVLVPQYSLTTAPVPHLVTCQAINATTVEMDDCTGTYPCTCTGSSETMCKYCALNTTRGNFCVVTGSSVTFTDQKTSLMTTCSCHHANGTANMKCYQFTSSLDETTTRASSGSSYSLTDYSSELP